MKNKVPKLPKLSKAKEELWRLFSRFIRYRDCLKTEGSLDHGRCITCNSYLEFKKLQAGHFLPGRNNAVLYNEKMVHAQCWKCNAPASLGGRNGNPLVYRRKIIEMYGAGADEEMEREADLTKQYKVYEILELQEIYKKKILDMGGTLK